MNRSRYELFFSFSLFLYRWEEISKSLSLGIFVPWILLESFFGNPILWSPKSSRSPKSQSLNVRIPLPLSSFLLFKWESLLGDFPCSSFLNVDFASYVSPSVALAIYCIVTSLGWAIWLLTLSWCITLHVVISLFFFIESNKSHDSLSLISYSPSTPFSWHDFSLSRVRLHPSM